MYIDRVHLKNNMCKLILYALALFFFCKTHAQICSCSGQMQQLMQGSIPVIANSPLLMPAQEFQTASQIIRPPTVATTIIDNSVSNALANTLQLLIVSDLIASTLNPHVTVSPCMLPPVAPICEPVPPPLIYTPPVDVILPRTEFVSPPCSPVVDILRPRCPCVEPIPNFYGVTEVLSPLINAAPLSALGPNLCGLQEIVSPVSNFAPVFGPSICLQEIGGPVQIPSLSSNYCGALTDLIGSIGNFGPNTAELIYSPGISGPMSCNGGYITPPMQCSNVNIEPIPYTGVSYFY